MGWPEGQRGSRECEETSRPNRNDKSIAFFLQRIKPTKIVSVIKGLGYRRFPFLGSNHHTAKEERIQR